jgi:hypothetical protein
MLIATAVLLLASCRGLKEADELQQEGQAMHSRGSAVETLIPSTCRQAGCKLLYAVDCGHWPP